jgi:outer membrane protein assembly factor BamA
MRFAFEKNLPNVANTKLRELQEFQRGLDIDDDWIVMRAESFVSFYLEPLIFGDAWRDPSTPRTSTMAHEVYLKVRGQYAFDNRLIPNEMQTVGGLYTVRGYEEAETPGDSMVLGSIEYRLHIPRLFTPDRNPVRIRAVGPFKVVPQHVYGLPDWDFVVRAFFDIGSAWTTRARSAVDVARDGELLRGAGLGVELLLMQNLSARFDYGWALKSTLQTDSGDGEARFVIQVQY